MNKFKVNELVDILLENRGLKTKREIDEFLNPNLNNVTIRNVVIDKKQLKKAIDRIKEAVKKQQQIVVYGDYDVDGVCGTAILWETLNSLGAKVLPYIPHRIEEGYGLSIKGIKNLTSNIEDCRLIITVDNGIVASEAVEFANKNGIDVIITDHHVPSKRLPQACAIVHTTKLCGAGVAWMLSRVILNSFQDLNSSKKMLKQVQHDKREDNHLELVALATIADLVPLVGANRTLTKFGLEKLRTTKRPGLLELFKEAVLDPASIDVYEVGHIIAPRLNAMGRIEHAMDSLRLLCTKDKARAQLLAHKLGSTNKERQKMTEETVQHAISGIRNQASPRDSARGELGIRNLLFVAHESYQQGVIGLVAGKLVEEFYRPAIVISKGKVYSKASARSVHGFNIIEFIRSAQEYLVDAGGHPMAAGFTVETAKLAILQKALEEGIATKLDEDLLTRTLRIDCELPLSMVDQKLFDELQKFSPFGMGNPQPSFVARKVMIEEMRLVGKEEKHLKFRLSCHPELGSGSRDSDLRQNDKIVFDAIAFGMGERAAEFRIGDVVDIVYTIDEDRWNGNQKLQLKIKDIAK